LARIIPADIATLELAGANRHELETLRVLQSRLPETYTVFHGVHWTREFPGETMFGELDFVVVNQSGRALLIEQKNGTLEETDSGLVAHYADGTKDVVRQVHRAIDNVREKFRRTQGGRVSIDLDYMIYCPSHRIARVNAAGVDATRIVDADARGRLPERIQETLGPGEPGRADWADVVQRFFCQTFELVPGVHAYVTGQERSFSRLSGSLLRLLDGLEMDPLRLRIRGAAGCGKTLAARHYFDRSLSRARRPLLVCFNRSLAERIKVTVRSGGLVTTWYGLCGQFLSERGVPLDFSQMREDPRFWDKVADRVMELQVPEEWKFDTLVVDEGQDFEPDWFDMFRMFLRDGADILWLEDADQNLRAQQPVALPGFIGFRVRANYRTPRSIARFIERTIPVEFEAASDLPGLGVGVSTYEDADDQPGIVAKIIADLVRRGFTHSQIVVLTARHLVTPGMPRSAFQDRERVGNYRLRRFTGEYDLLGNQDFTDGQIVFDSIGRFKGQEAPAVILVDIDAAPQDTLEIERLLYAGMTRATVRLELVVRQGTAVADRLLAAAR
jgi:hypothetical protein